MSRFFTSIIAFVFLFFLVSAGDSWAQNQESPFEFMKRQELAHKDSAGEVYLGKVMTLAYPLNSVEVDERYYPFLLELTDVLKTPMRKEYRIVIKGHPDDYNTDDLKLQSSRKRVQTLKQTLTDRYYIEGERISVQGPIMPLDLNEKREALSQDGRVEIHLYGDVTEAVRFAE
jgi:outer membrane protein OmpA-like peptidoglycan-associated protein